MRLHEIIFEADTPGGKAFDLTLLVCIVLSVAGSSAPSSDRRVSSAATSISPASS